MAELGLSPAQAMTLSQHPATARFFEDVLRAFPHGVKAANWIQTEVLQGTKFHGLSATFPVTEAQVAELLGLVEKGDISGKQAKEIHRAVAGTGNSPAAVVEALGMRVVSDDSALRPICERIVLASPKQAAEYRSGRKGILGYFVGQVMTETRGSANPKRVSDIVQKLLEDGS